MKESGNPRNIKPDGMPATHSSITIMPAQCHAALSPTATHSSYLHSTWHTAKHSHTAHSYKHTCIALGTQPSTRQHSLHTNPYTCMYTLLHNNCLREKQNCLHIHTRQDSKFSTHTAHTHAAHAGETSCRIARVKAISHLKGKIIYLPNKTKCVHVGML